MLVLLASTDTILGERWRSTLTAFHGQADFGKLGRSKSDAQTEPFLIEALWRREVAAGSTDKTKSLSKAEISELLEQVGRAIRSRNSGAIRRNSGAIL